MVSIKSPCLLLFLFCRSAVPPSDGNTTVLLHPAICHVDNHVGQTACHLLKLEDHFISPGKEDHTHRNDVWYTLSYLCGAGDTQSSRAIVAELYLKKLFHPFNPSLSTGMLMILSAISRSLSCHQHGCWYAVFRSNFTAPTCL